ncbi:6-phosphogluconolactonase [Hoeflea poritis]|uniref:6-phosphogluconolactonase n=1 Tax=Hoeflea poritis TaxID=2993659 RepID=A0ABT4VSJ0_9HYPH|nr:6-phosphogluconolactonase [Hoeflea poritis]MDA4847569.1 6-phosphogluconolactonase [Hoeflea poritis]
MKADRHEPQFNNYANRQALAAALSADIAGALQTAIMRDGAAVLAVSGGSTPRNMFQALSRTDIDWSKVIVTLVDERFVPPSHERSNHRLVATHLLQNEAAFAQFIPLYCEGFSPEEAANEAASKIDALEKPIDIAVLGLGTDGHTASWFPGSPELAAATDPEQEKTVMAIEAPGIPEPRLTLTQPVLHGAESVILHIEGTEKRDVLEAALEPGPVEALPVRAILRETKRPLQVYWAP